MTKNSNRIIIYILTIALATVSLVAVIYIGITAFQVIHYGIPVELRDLSTFRAADSIAAGINPYSLDTIWSTGNTPQLYQYSFLEPLVVAGIMRLTGAGSLAVSVVLNLIYLILATGLIGNVVRRRYDAGIIGYLLTFLQICLAYTMFWGHRPALTIRADGLGILFMALIYYLLDRYSDRIILIGVMSALLFATKQFYVLIFFPVLIYYILQGKKQAIKYVVNCILAGIVELIICQLCMPTYLLSTIFSQFMSAGTVGGLRDAIWNYGLIIIRQELPVVVILCIAAVMLLLQLHSTSESCDNKQIKRLWNLCKESPYETAMALGGIILALFLIRLAMNGMDGIKYINALLIIPVNILLWAAIKYLREWGNNRNIKWLAVAVPFLILAQAILPVQAYDWSSMSADELAAWDKTEAYTSEYEADEMFLSPIASMVLHTDAQSMKDGYYDDGHLQYFEYEDMDEDIVDLFPGVAEQKSAIAQFKETLDNKICNEEFELIMTQDNLWCIDSEHLAEHYDMIDEYQLEAMVNDVEIQVWKKK